MLRTASKLTYHQGVLLPLRSVELLLFSQSSSEGLKRVAIEAASAVCRHSAPPSERTVSWRQYYEFVT